MSDRQIVAIVVRWMVLAFTVGIGVGIALGRFTHSPL